MIEKYTLTLGELIENNVNIFDFDYPIYTEEYRKTFEKHFIDFFYFDEIGLETVARFKHALNIKLNLIMPYWNKIIMADSLEQRILDNYDVTEESERKIINNESNTSNNLNKYTDKPMTRSNITDNDFLTSITKDEVNNNLEGEQIETFKYHKSGNIGVQTDSDSIVKFWQSLRKIEIEIFKDCEDLFMGVF